MKLYLACGEVAKVERGFITPLPLEPPLPDFAPKHGAESEHSDGNTPAGRTDTAGVTRRFGGNLWRGCYPNSRMAEIQPWVATKEAANAPASVPARVRGPCKP